MEGMEEDFQVPSHCSQLLSKPEVHHDHLRAQFQVLNPLHPANSCHYRTPDMYKSSLIAVAWHAVTDADICFSWWVATNHYDNHSFILYSTLTENPIS